MLAAGVTPPTSTPPVVAESPDEYKVKVEAAKKSVP